MNSVGAPRVRPGLRRIAIVAFVILIPIAAHALWDYIEVRRLVREVARIRDSGEPVADRDLGPTSPQTDEQKRAARLYFAAGGAAVPPYEIDRQLPTDLFAVGPAMRDDQARREQFVRRLERVVAANTDAFALLDKATPLDFVAFPPGTEYNYRTASVWTLTAVNELRAAHQCLSGHPDAAVDAAIAGFRLFRVDRFRAWWMTGSRPGFRIVPFILSHCQPSADVLARLQDAAQVTVVDATVAAALTRASMTDRAMFLSRIWRLYGFDVRAPEAVRYRMFPIEEAALRPWYTHMAVRELHDRAALIEAEKLPARERLVAIEALQQRHSARSASGGMFARGMVLGSVGVEVPNMMSSFGFSGASIAAIAAERYRRDNDTHPPATLSALVPKYLSSVPIDPFTDSPLSYAARDGEYVVYSVGRDGKDDGGDVRPGPPKWQSGQPTPSRDLGVFVTLRPATK